MIIETNTTNNFLDGNITFISEIFQDKIKNPNITFKNDSEGNIGIHLSGWDSQESIEIYDVSDAQELIDTLHEAINFLSSIKSDKFNNQLNLFENIKETNIVREN
jgi:hypothetical protein